MGAEFWELDKRRTSVCFYVSRRVKTSYFSVRLMDRCFEMCSVCMLFCLARVWHIWYVCRLFGACLAFFWHSLRYSFLGKFLSWSVAFVCNGLQSTSSDCVFAVLFVVFFIVLVSTLFVFSRPVWCIAKFVVCVMTVGFAARVSQYIVNTFIADASRPMSRRIVVWRAR